MSDAAVIADFNARMAWETEKRRLELDRVRAGVTALLNDPSKGVYFVAEIESGASVFVAGQLLITYEWSDWRNGKFWWVQSVFVAEKFRGMGIFRALFEHVHALARSQPDICGVRLYMDAENTQARRVYERLGLNQTNYQVFEMNFIPKDHR